MSKYSVAIKRLKNNYTYDLNQLHESFGLHPQTVRGWIKLKEKPLTVIQLRPTLIFSEDLRIYLQAKEKRRKFTTNASQLPCMGCKAPQVPFENKVHFAEVGQRVYLKGICPCCGHIMNKMQSTNKLALITPLFKRITLQDLHILGRSISNGKAHSNENMYEVATDTHLFKQNRLI